MRTQHPTYSDNLPEVVRKFLNSLGDKALNLSEQEITVALPAPIFRVFVEHLQKLAAPEEPEISTKEGAMLLQVSRPHFVKLLDEGKVPFRKVGAHRRVRKVDVLNYKETLWKEAKEAADELVKQAQELDMGY